MHTSLKYLLHFLISGLTTQIFCYYYELHSTISSVSITTTPTLSTSRDMIYMITFYSPLMDRVVRDSAHVGLLPLMTLVTLQYKIHNINMYFISLIKSYPFPL